MDGFNWITKQVDAQEESQRLINRFVCEDKREDEQTEKVSFQFEPHEFAD